MKKLSLIILCFCVSNIIEINAQDDNIITISDDVYLEPLIENLYIHISYKFIENYGNVGANGLLYIEDDFAVLIDTPWGSELTKILCDYVLRTFNVKINTVIVTHSHDDCMGGLEELHSRGAISYCYELTKEFTIRDSLPIPIISFSDSLILRFPKISFNLYYLGAGHTRDNIVIYIPDNKILFSGCMIKSLDSKNLGNITEGDLEEYPKTLDKLLKKFKEAQIVIPGHGNYGGLDLIHHTLKLIKNY